VRLSALALWVTMAGCASNGAVLTQQEVETYGRHRFEVDPNRVFDAALGALRSEGYGIAYSQREAGLIKTTRKHVGYYVQGRWGSVATYRQFQINIRPLSPGVTEVTAVPFLFIGESNVSNQDFWNLDAERSGWTTLFGEIEQFLTAPKVIPPSPSGL
jgi:hypothetical protein